MKIKLNVFLGIMILCAFATLSVGCSVTIEDGCVYTGTPGPVCSRVLESDIVQLRNYYQDEVLILRLLAENDDMTLKLSVSYEADDNEFVELEAYNKGGGYGAFWEFIDSYMVDIDGDGALDLLVTATFVTGLGEEGMVPHPRALVYMRTPDGFKFDSNCTDNIFFYYDDSIYNFDALANWLKAQ